MKTLIFCCTFIVFLSSAYVVRKNQTEVAPNRRIITNFLGSFRNDQVPVNLNMWLCGSKQTQYVAYHGLAVACMRKTPDMNMCCAVHDNCYDLQLGKVNCDDKFCECLETAFKDGSCSNEIPKTMCSAVRRFGGSSYLSPDIGAPKHFKDVHPVVDKNGIMVYRSMYKSCITIRETLAICAYNHNVCYARNFPEFSYYLNFEECKEQLHRCISDSVEFLLSEGNHEKCKTKVEAFLDYVQEEDTITW